MKVIYLLFIFLIYYSVAFSQTYSGKLVDKHSGVPILYANIGISNKNIGTVSNAKGEFKLELNSTENYDTLFISCIGYERKSYLISNFINSYRSSDQIIIELQPKVYELAEVVVRPIGRKIYTGLQRDESSRRRFIHPTTQDSCASWAFRGGSFPRRKSVGGWMEPSGAAGVSSITVRS